MSVLCSNPDMDVQDVVWAIFCRWLQENDFKYLDTHYGLSRLDSRDKVIKDASPEDNLKSEQHFPVIKNYV